MAFTLFLISFFVGSIAVAAAPASGAVTHTGVMLLFVVSAVLLTGAAIVNAVNNLAKKIEGSPSPSKANLSK